MKMLQLAKLAVCNCQVSSQKRTALQDLVARTCRSLELVERSTRTRLDTASDPLMNL